MASASHTYVVCQLGARMHYAVPRFLHGAGRLERFHTDLYAKRWWARGVESLPEAWRPAALRRLIGRGTELPDRLVRSYSALGLLYAARNARARDSAEATAIFLWAGHAFGRRVVRDGFGAASAVYTFNTAALEILAAARARGLRTVLEQTIAPRAVEEQLMHDEQARHRDWEPPRTKSEAAAATAERESREWALADVIVCGSEFVRDGIKRCGGPVDRCVVVPYGVDAVAGGRASQPSADRPLRVLTVGHVALRKGAPYVMAAAQALPGVAEFRWVGPVMINDGAAAELARHVDVRGAVPRSDVAAHYAWADVFLLPSICEGSATVTYEALSRGLPVITTRSAGSPVRDGVDGFVVDERDTEGLIARLRQLHGDPALVERLAEGASAGAGALTLAAYRQRLLLVLLNEVTTA
jgi:glycosyltransferase involved in cell wall biosynthesis